MSDISTPQAHSPSGPTLTAAAASSAHGERVDELHAIVKWTLDREDDAASTIRKLSYRIDGDSELARKARNYAVELHRYVARLKALLPSRDKAASEPSALGNVSERVIGSLDREKATLFLIEFLLQHAETTSAILQSAGGRMNSKGFEALWRKAEGERRQIAAWIKADERHQLEVKARAATAPAPAKPSSNASCAVEPAKTGGIPGSAGLANAGLAHKATARERVPRIDYHPRQIVKWM